MNNELHTTYFDCIKGATRLTSKGTKESLLNSNNETLLLRIVNNFNRGDDVGICSSGLTLCRGTSAQSCPILEVPIDNQISGVSSDGTEVTIPFQIGKNILRYFSFNFFDVAAAKLFFLAYHSANLWYSRSVCQAFITLTLVP